MQALEAQEDIEGREPNQQPAEGDIRDDLARIVGENLRRLRTRRGLSLERLAKASSVSRAMLGQIELGRSAPTITVLWKIAQALDVPFSVFTAQVGGSDVTLLRQRDSLRFLSPDGSFSSRALFPFDRPRRTEFYEVRLDAHSRAESAAHPAGTLENLTLSRGILDVEIGGRRHSIEVGDAIQFRADAPHAYHNLGDGPAVFYLVMSYAEAVG